MSLYIHTFVISISYAQQEIIYQSIIRIKVKMDCVLKKISQMNENLINFVYLPKTLNAFYTTLLKTEINLLSIVPFIGEIHSQKTSFKIN